MQGDEPYVYFGVRVMGDAQGYVDPLTLLPPRLVATPAPVADAVVAVTVPAETAPVAAPDAPPVAAAPGVSLETPANPAPTEVPVPAPALGPVTVEAPPAVQSPQADVPPSVTISAAEDSARTLHPDAARAFHEQNVAGPYDPAYNA